jgi:Helix-turn-helix domain
MTAETHEKLTLSVPEAGRIYFDIKSRAGAYAAAQRGDIPTIRIGRRVRVPVRALERMLDNAGGKQ